MVSIVKVLSPLVGLGILGWTVPKVLSAAPVGLPEGIHLPGIALELPRSSEEVRRIPSELKEGVRQNLPTDTYVIVPLYVVLFLAFAVEFSREERPLIGWAMGLLTLVAGISDEFENHFQTALLAASDPNEIEVLHVWRAGTLKWACLSVVMGLLGVAVLSRPGSWRLVTGISLASTVLFWVGLGWHRPLVQYAFSLMGLALLMAGVLAWCAVP